MTFQEVLLRRHVRFRQGTDKAKIHICCPFCAVRGKEADTLYRLCVHSVQGWGRCMHCDWRHRYAVYPVLKQFGINEQIQGFDTPTRQEKQEQVSLPSDFLLLTEAFDELDCQARDYILKRGVLRRQVVEDQIGVSYSGRYAYRVLFPVFVRNELKTINARDFTGTQKPKYLLSKGDKYLYRFDPKARTVVLSEGSIKALRLSQVTEANSAALLGHDLTDVQAEQLEHSECIRIILYADPEPVGRRGMVKIADKILGLRKRIEINIAWPIEKPADEAPLKSMERLLDTALPYDLYTRQKLLP